MAAPQQTKHVPMRRCIATGESLPKKELLRFVRVADGDGAARVVVDVTGKLRGRGANISPTLEAFDLAIKKKAIDNALKLEDKLTPAEVKTLREQFATAISEREFRQGRKPVKLKISREEFVAKVEQA